MSTNQLKYICVYLHSAAVPVAAVNLLRWHLQSTCIVHVLYILEISYMTLVFPPRLIQ